MASTEKVHVNLGPQSYDIEIGTGNLPETHQFFSKLSQSKQAVIITDSNVESVQASRVAESLSQLDLNVDLLVIEAGEASKSLEVYGLLLEKLLEMGADRKTVVVAVGGGVVGDLAGFVAASYARGIPFFQIPTSLLAQVDSSVGGKVGINLPGAKNMVGAFWQPLGVLIDTEVLETLPEREYLSGLAEVVKYGIIMDAEFFDYLENNIDGLLNRDDAVMRHIVARSCRLKADVVEQDERESGLRAILNYGHTFCHAFETLTGYGHLLHGEAVSIGMRCAAQLSERLGRTDASLTQRITKLLVALQLPVETPDVDPDEVLEVMGRDKKTLDGQLRFVLPTKMGHVEVVSDVSRGDVFASL